MNRLFCRVIGVALLGMVAAAPAAQAQGTLDPSFGGAGIQLMALGDSARVSRIAPAPGDALMVAGVVLQYGAWRPWVARLNATGAVDTRFGGGVVGILYDPEAARFSEPVVALSTWGERTYVAVNDGRQIEVWAFLSSGLLDPTFSDGVGVPGRVLALRDHELMFSLAISVGPSRVLVGTGGRLGAGANRDFIVAARKIDGRAEPSFGTGGIVYSRLFSGAATSHRVTALAQLVDGRVMLAGRVYKGSSEPSDLVLGRLLPNGQPDKRFGLAGFARDQRPTEDYGARSLTVFGDGRVMVPVTYFDWPLSGDGGFTALDRSVAGVVKFRANGDRDSSFGIDGEALLPLDGSTIAGEALRDASDRVVLTASYCKLDGEGCTALLARFTVSGALDPGFGDAGIARLDVRGYDYFTSAALQYDRIVTVGGSYVFGALNDSLENTSVGLLARYLGR